MNMFSTERYNHSPVMLSETINNLNISDSGFYIDGTVGLGGHSYEILENLANAFLFFPLFIAKLSEKILKS